MPKLRHRLPPLNSLVAFEASARLLSFTKAGKELLISREAVSRQIRILEGHLEVKLFERLYRALELTEAGETLYKAVRQNLENIARAAEGLRRAGKPARVTVTATIAIASYWLTPRLPRFRARHRDVEIRVVVSDGPVDLGAGIDLGLRYGDGTWPGLEARHLFDVVSFPVCAPDYAEKNGAINRPGDLTTHSLLNLDGPSHAGEDWTWWLAGAGVRPPEDLQVLGFDNYANVIQAALDGQGIALGFGGIIDPLIDRGQLVRPIEASLSAGSAVYLVTPADRAADAPRPGLLRLGDRGDGGLVTAARAPRP